MRKCLMVLMAVAMAVVLAACAVIPKEEELAKTFAPHKVFGSQMVLQRERPIKISGTGEAGKFVKVDLGNKHVYAKADENGEWEAVFPAMKAGGPYTIAVSGGSDSPKIEFNDVLIGEVWMCSGQSNMQMPVYGGQFWRVVNFEEEAKNANHPNIRLFNSKRRVSPTVRQKEEEGSGWLVCSPENVKDFSAVAYFFGRELQRDLDVPIGLINASWGGTKIEPWISEEMFEAEKRDNELAQIYAARSQSQDEQKTQELEEKKKAQDAVFKSWLDKFNNYSPSKSKKAAVWKNRDYDDSKWEAAIIPSGFPEGVDGIGWFRRTVELPERWAGQNLTLTLGAVDDCDITYFNGVKIGETGVDVPNYWSVKRVYRIPGNLVEAGKNVIAVRVSDFFSNGGIMGRENEIALRLDGTKEKIKLYENWKFRLEFAIDSKKIGNRPNIDVSTPLTSPQFPSTLFNGMIAPWLKYQIRGVIWYQGCSNAGNPDYYQLHKMLIQDWRNQWKNPSMPFLVTQLAGFQKHVPRQRLADDYWTLVPADANAPYALTREIQAEMLNLPNTGLAVTIDIGDHSDIHPANKQDVGYRLARESMRVAYGCDEITQGPTFNKFEVDGDKVKVFFDNVGDGLATSDGQRPGAFAVAGTDGKFHWADQSEIVNGTVVVSSSKVKEPKAVRYAWSQYRGDINLCNKNGFAAMPFRSDKPEYK